MLLSNRDEKFSIIKREEKDKQNSNNIAFLVPLND
jgi:hypothetical protein